MYHKPCPLGEAHTQKGKQSHLLAAATLRGTGCVETDDRSLMVGPVFSISENANEIFPLVHHKQQVQSILPMRAL